jgi:CubicO group peptidase (beta-lactamase class C family)
MKTILLAFLSLLLSAQVSAQSENTVPGKTEAEILQKIDQLIEPYNNSNTPGGVIMVMREGAVVFEKAFGMANLQHEIPFTLETKTNIGSTSKQFTAFAIALLRQQGQLDLTDDIRNYLPELPDLGHTVTLAHLISHTSGYRELFNTLMMSGMDISDQIRRSEVIPLVQRQPELQNVPGEVWNYNNTGYILLAMVVEKVTGEPFDKWMMANVFVPLNMKNTIVRMDPRQIIKNSAQGYVKDEQESYREVMDLYTSTGAGGIYTTTGDLSKWIGNYLTPVLGDKSIVEQMTTPYILNSGEKTNYGMGLITDKLNGLERFQHGGADIAHRSHFYVFPTIGGAVVFLSNNAQISQDIPLKVAELFFDDVMDEKSNDGFNYDQVYTEFKPENFDDFTGRFALEVAPDFIMEYTREGSQFFAQATGQPRFEIFPGSDSTFFLKVVRAGITFHRNEEGKVNRMTLHQNGKVRANRIMEVQWQPSEEEITSYTGKYFSEELESYYTVTLNNDNKLVLRHRRTGDIMLKENKRDEFNGTMPISVVSFVRDKENRITGFKASNGRATNVLFVKMPPAPPAL